MKLTKLFLLSVSFVLWFFPAYVHAQDEMDGEEFLGVMSITFTDEQLDELSYLLPWDISVFAYAHGDFSNDGREDAVVALKELNVTPDHTLDVYFFENINNRTFKLVKKRNIKWVELPIEIAFLAKEGTCCVTNRDLSNWYFTTYKISDDELIQVDRAVYPIKVGKAGEN